MIETPKLPDDALWSPGNGQGACDGPNDARSDEVLGKHFHSLMMELEKKSQVSGLAWSTAVNVAVTENADVGFFLEHPRWKSA